MSQEVLINLIRNIGSEITLLKLLTHLPGSNEINDAYNFVFFAKVMTWATTILQS